jgi:hypothetical protein
LLALCSAFHADDFAAVAAACGHKSAVIAAALEEAYRVAARRAAAQLAVNAADAAELLDFIAPTSAADLSDLTLAKATSAADLLNLAATYTGDLEQQQSQLLITDQQGLHLTCLKAAAAALGSSMPAAYIVAAAAQRALQLPGVHDAGMRAINAAAAAAEDSIAALVQQFSSMPAEVSRSHELASSSSCGNSGNGGSSSSSSNGRDDPTMLLLLARTMYIAGRALQQLHDMSQEQRTADRCEGLNEAWPELMVACTFDDMSAVMRVALPLLGCVAAARPALQQAANVQQEALSSNSSSSSSSTTVVTAQQSMSDLLQQVHLLQASLAASLMVGRPGLDDLSAATAVRGRDEVIAELKSVLSADVAAQLVQLGSGICVHLAAGQHWCCANPGCTSLDASSEQQLVAGKGTVCSACRSVRLCGAACNKAYWKAGHKQVCALFRQQRQSQA